jgi:hypothetical protein
MRKLLKTMALIIGGSMVFLANAFATNNNVPEESVYISASERDEIYNIIQTSERFMGHKRFGETTLLFESIMPMYRGCFLEYAETGIFRIWPLVGYSIYPVDKPTERNFTAKTVTSEGLFAGNITFQIRDGIADQKTFSRSEYWVDPTGEFPAGSDVSLNYADHARRIQELLGRDSFVPVCQVRYVNIYNLGQIFYINDGETQALVNISGGGKGSARNVFTEENRDIVFIGDELHSKAQEHLEEHNALMTWIEEFIAEHGESPIGGGVSAPTIAPAPSAIDDITDISAYLGDAWVIPQTGGEGGGISLQVLLGFVGVFALMGAGAVVYFRK